MTSVGLPALSAVGDVLYFFDDAMLAGLSFPALRTVGSDLRASTNAALTSLAFPALTVIGGDLVVAQREGGKMQVVRATRDRIGVLALVSLRERVLARGVGLSERRLIGRIRKPVQLVIAEPEYDVAPSGP